MAKHPQGRLSTPRCQLAWADTGGVSGSVAVGEDALWTAQSPAQLQTFVSSALPGLHHQLQAVASDCCWRWTLNGIDRSELPEGLWESCIGLMNPAAKCGGRTPLEAVLQARPCPGQPVLDQVARDCGLQPWLAQLGGWLAPLPASMPQEYSQALALARVWLSAPKILIWLGEPSPMRYLLLGRCGVLTVAQRGTPQSPVLPISRDKPALRAR